MILEGKNPSRVTYSSISEHFLIGFLFDKSYLKFQFYICTFCKCSYIYLLILI